MYSAAPDLEVKDLYSKCDIADMGTFYFVYGKELRPMGGQ